MKVVTWSYQGYRAVCDMHDAILACIVHGRPVSWLRRRA